MTTGTDYISMQNRICDETGGMTNLLSVTPGMSTPLSPIQQAIQNAIAKFERQRFYFNELREVSAFSTVAGQEFYSSSDWADIATLAQIDVITVTVSGNRYPLTARTYGYLEKISFNTTSRGQPRDYCYYDQQIRLWAVPDAVYAITVSGLQRFATLTNDTDTNAWMTDGEALIRCEAKRDLYANTLQDPEQAQAMLIEIYGNPAVPADKGALGVLRSETTARVGQGRIVPTSF